MTFSRLTLLGCAFSFIVGVVAACANDVSLGDRSGPSCALEAGAALDMQCGNIQCNGETQWCSVLTWPGPCKPLPCECAAAPSAQSCTCLMQYGGTLCDDGGTPACKTSDAGLYVTCN